MSASGTLGMLMAFSIPIWDWLKLRWRRSRSAIGPIECPRSSCRIRRSPAPAPTIAAANRAAPQPSVAVTPGVDITGSGRPGVPAPPAPRRCPIDRAARPLQRDRRGDARALAADRAAHHVAHRGVDDLVAADAAAGDQQIVDALGQQRAVGHVEIAPGGRQDQDAVAVDELGKDADGVVEPRLLAHVRAGEVVERVDLAGVANAQRHAEIAQLGVLAAGHEARQRLDRVDGLAPPSHLADGQVGRVGAVDFRHVHQVEIGQVALVRHRAPGAGDGVQIRRACRPAASACLNGLRRNGENSSSSLPLVSMSHSPLPAQSV